MTEIANLSTGCGQFQARELTEQSLRGTAEGKKLPEQHKFACTEQGSG